MQFVDDITPADLNDVATDTRSKADSRAGRLATIPKLLTRCLAVPMGLASMVALAIEGAFSMAGYGAAKLLGKVRLVRGGYQFLSKTYDRLLERLGHKVLRDPRDTPALRLMVSLTFTVVPIFLLQLVFRETSASAGDRFLPFLVPA